MANWSQYRIPLKLEKESGTQVDLWYLQIRIYNHMNVMLAIDDITWASGMEINLYGEVSTKKLLSQERTQIQGNSASTANLPPLRERLPLQIP